MELYENFCRNVRAELAQREQSINAFCAESEIPSRTYFMNVLNGHANPTLGYCEMISEHLGVPVEQLLGISKKLSKTA